MPTRLRITLDMGSGVSASHRLMELVGQQAELRAKGEERTAVCSLVISTLTLIRKTESGANDLNKSVKRLLLSNNCNKSWSINVLNSIYMIKLYILMCTVDQDIKIHIIMSPQI